MKIKADRYRSKYIEISAMQIPDEEEIEKRTEFEAWIESVRGDRGWKWNHALGGVNVQTLEGVMHGPVGHWIICGTEGEIYPCKDSVFQTRYEPLPRRTKGKKAA